MKTPTYFRIDVFVTQCMLFLLASSSLYAQSWQNGRYMKQAINETMVKAVLAEQSTSAGFANGICFLGAILKKGHEVGWTTTLMGDQEYIFIGGGDQDATDVDISVSNTPGTLLAKDTQSDKTPIVQFTPTRTGQYTIKLKLYSGDNDSFCCMAILKEGGNRVPAGNLDNVVGKIINYGARANEQKGGAKFHDLTNQWCMYGAILDEGSKTEIENLNLGYQNHAFLAAGDQNSEDLDLYLLRNETEIKKDTDSDSVPNVVSETYGSNYGLKVKNHASSGKTFAMFCILTM
ncbi:hypothetical protein GO730_32485 [Spirosoma sp. HMF3257]|uniref:Uncharacterized protein n=1 Tax=Spirosoma telluris TaxID=2183553 RepID=A0A327NQZ7_9BACT|nr:hypothetical protein [Spirosoma telluris]RAI77667.1 hypothetical protein HMF3257_32385 [Spirosoma telluris]